MSMRYQIVIILALVGACTAGPQPPYYHPPSVRLSFHVADPPSPTPPNVTINLDFVPYCSPYDALSADGRGGEPEGYGFTAFQPDAPHMTVMVTSSYSKYQGPCQGSARFFRPSLLFETPSGTWLADAFAIYAPAALTFRPFGPDGAQVSVPAGASLVRRGCGSDGATTLTLLSPDDVLEFHRRPDDLSTLPKTGEFEDDERRFLAACGGPAPPQADLGSRVGLDAPSVLAWSADQSGIYYLVPPSQSGTADWQRPQASLRFVPLGGGAPVELATGLSNTWLIAPASGDVFVQDRDAIERGQRQADGSVALIRLPLPASTPSPPLISPDGKWIAIGGGQSPPYSTTLWDVAAGTAGNAIPGVAVAWSPDSRRLALRDTSDDGLLQRFFVEDLGTATSTLVGTADDFVWSPQGTPVLVHSSNRPMTIDILDAAMPRTIQVPVGGGPTAWADGRPLWFITKPWLMLESQGKGGLVGGPGGGEAGLMIDDGLGSTPRTVVPTSETSLDYFSAHPSLLSNDGTALVWTRRCFGLYETLCAFQLHQISLPDGADRIVAISTERPVSALSPDHRRVAIGTSRGIFVKDLP